MITVSATTSHPDGALIEASGQFCALMDQLAKGDFEADPGTTRQHEAKQALKNILTEMRATAQRMSELTATTPAGLAARAIAMGIFDPDHTHDHEMHGSICRIMLDAQLRDGAALADQKREEPGG